MKKQIFILSTLSFFLICCSTTSQINTNAVSPPAKKVNVFLGSSGDHGQMSPSASSPFNMLSIGPQTYSHNHTGYEYYAERYEGFTHTHLEGVGCTGSGGNILIKPVLNKDIDTKLLKKEQQASPGYYEVSFENGVHAAMSVNHNFGLESYTFPKDTYEKGLYIDLSFALANRFISEEHTINNNVISGWIDTHTTCHRGVYRIYYALAVSNLNKFEKLSDHKYYAGLNPNTDNTTVQISFSSVNVEYAKNKLSDINLETVKKASNQEWNSLLSYVKVQGEDDRENLFYSLLYRGLQSPYKISEKDGTYSAINGTTQKADFEVYNGWAIWDNYREQLPMLSLLYPDKYADISKSIANLYKYGKKDWSTRHEPSPTVRTEHALVVLLDAYEKKYPLDFLPIKDSIIAEVNKLNFGAPDKALESSYDFWAASKIMEILKDDKLAKAYHNKSLDYKKYWKKDFADLTKNDVDKMQARGLYQGTIWQYRWFVPYDIDGLKNLAGDEKQFIKELDQFFEENNYNHANQPDLQVPGLYNATKQPWKSQKLFRNILLDTVVQNYFNDNSKGTDPYIGKIYKNQPRAYLRTMDDDAGTMSSWFVMRSIGLSPVNIGTPVYYLTAPIFKKVSISYPNGKKFEIEVKNYHKDHFYIKSATLNGKPLNQNWLHHKDIIKGGKLIIETSETPNTKWGIENTFVTKIKSSN
ncbi:glycoside hydrolase domain-containing protein [Mariniflexile litorale]|uniref:Glycoside hydrolase domain-containing protein n=1 Tax=Mariniflexile litorale TaxID=3045158 RepID=A0AAU7EFZ5_9FLAO|nr:glycoside hydrolase domain-containing protein [Mariniflexile sp. KMM 9835]MDQ8211946.1 glycoside hydrolase family 92 protein [Mariniflexile sp. KMM 9835]